MNDVPSRRCRRCGAALAGRADRRYCSDACRVAEHRRQHRRTAPRLTLVEVDRFVDALGEATTEAALVAGIARAARRDWRAAAWVLSHRWPERWALR